MRRWTMRISLGLGAFLIVAAVFGATYQWVATRKELAATPPPAHLVDIGGYKLHLWCTGDGAPAVILDTGLGGSSADWGFVQPDVARFTRVCSYDRAGMGYSDPGPSPRTARRIASELAELLVRSGIGGPVVLVGASIVHVRESAEEVRSSRRKLTLPILVVTGARGADENWRLLPQDLASLSERGCLIVAPRSGHLVQTDQPEIVVDAIRTVVEIARGHDVPFCATPANR
jgi:pimeloyl-ACP methyl ester carboxylesterase